MSGFDEVIIEDAAEGMRRLLERVSALEEKEYLTPGSIIIGTGLELKTLTKVFADTPYTFLTTDFAIKYDATGGSVIARLPTAASSFDATTDIGKIYQINKIDVSVNTVTLQGAGAELINGSNTQVISIQYDQISVQSNGTSWNIIL